MWNDCEPRTAYQFSHRSDDGKTYYWYSRRPISGSSLIEEIRCDVETFWEDWFGDDMYDAYLEWLED